MRDWVRRSGVRRHSRLHERRGRGVEYLRGVRLGWDRVTDRRKLLGVYRGLGAGVFRERLCLNGGISPSNLRVHLEVDHRSGNRWWWRAAILRGQEFERRRELWSEVVDLIVWARRGAMVKTHVSTSSAVSAEVSSFEG